MKKILALAAAALILTGAVSALTINIDVFDFGDSNTTAKTQGDSTGNPGDTYNDPSINRSAPEHRTRVDDSRPITGEEKKPGLVARFQEFLNSLFS
ncbi:MAG: hypothetical protein ABEJ69_01350 [Candidatus Nanohaloarchaea archaeon]